jgi:hypothetical protein
MVASTMPLEPCDGFLPKQVARISLKGAPKHIATASAPVISVLAKVLPSDLVARGDRGWLADLRAKQSGRSNDQFGENQDYDENL